MKARRTMHKGIEMRSRLEALWAAALDNAGIGWVYEPIAFSGSGGQYLPDFFIPSLGLYLEVKPVDEVEANYRHAWLRRMEIIWESEPAAALMLVAGHPEPEAHQAYGNDADGKGWWETQHTISGLSATLAGRGAA